MKEQDVLKDLFSEKLGNYQPKVNPELWANISSQVASSTTTVASGTSILTKIIVGIGITAAVTVTTVLLTNKPTNNTPAPDKHNKTENVFLDKSNSNENDYTVQDAPPERVAKKEAQPVNELVPNRIENEVVHMVQEEEQMKTETIWDEMEIIQQETHLEINEKAEEINEDVLVEENQKDELDTQKDKTLDENDRIKLFNVFTPNGDSDNDYLYIESSDLTDFNVVVLNRNNQVVYQSSDPNFKWFGNTLDGQPVPAGNYVYFITAVDKKGNPINEHSSLSIIR